MTLALVDSPAQETDSPTSVHPKETTTQGQHALTYRRKLILNCETEYAATKTTYEQLDSIQGKLRTFELEDCRTSAWYAVHLQSGTVRVLSSSCRLRWCPMCSSARSRLIVGNLSPWLSQCRSAKFLTLTLKHSDDPLQSQITRLYECFSELRRRAYIQQSIAGGVWFFQIKWSERSSQWHPHLHCVLDADYMPHKRLKELWLSVTGDSNIVDIRAVRDPKKVAEYVARYAARPCQLSELNNVQRLDVVLSMWGRRLCGKWGDCKDLQLSQRPADIQNEYVTICPFSQLKSLAEKSIFARTCRQAWLDNRPLDRQACRAEVVRAVQDMWDIIRPPPIPKPVPLQGVLFDDDKCFLEASNRWANRI